LHDLFLKTSHFWPFLADLTAKKISPDTLPREITFSKADLPI